MDRLKFNYTNRINIFCKPNLRSSIYAYYALKKIGFFDFTPKIKINKKPVENQRPQEK